MTDYAIDVLDNLIREELPSTISESLPDIAPVYKNIKQTSLGVTREGIGRDWKVEHLFNTGVAGLMRNADPNGAALHAFTSGADQVNIFDTNTGDAFDIFPKGQYAPHTSSLKRELALHMSTGNFTIPVTWLQGDALSASQIKQVSRDIKAVGQMRALTEAISFFMSNDNALCYFNENGDDTAVSDANTKLVIKPLQSNIQFFRVGMMVDIYADDGTGTTTGAPSWGLTEETDIINTNDTDGECGIQDSNYIPIVVTDVDYLGGLVTLEIPGGADIGGSGAAFNSMTGGAISLADGDDTYWWIVEAGSGRGDTSREMRTWGLEDWIKGSGQIMGGASSADALDLDTYSQFKSQVVDVSAPLTEDIMNRYIGGFLNAYPGSSLDTIITTMGVTMKYLESASLSNNRFVYDRAGKALSVTGGWQDVEYMFNGRMYTWMIAPLCMSGTLYALKMNGGNIKRYVPPRVGGSDNRIGSEIEFLANLAGHKNIFKIAHGSSGQSQSLLEAPFWQYCLIAPDDVRGVKLTNLTEADMN